MTQDYNYAKLKEYYNLMITMPHKYKMGITGKTWELYELHTNYELNITQWLLADSFYMEKQYDS